MNDDGTASADAVRARMAPPVSRKKSDRGVTARDSRLLSRAFSGAFPMRCRMTPTSSARLRTAQLSKRTGRRPAQGGTRNGALAAPAGFDGQDSGGHGRAWPSCAFCSSPGAGPRYLRHSGSA